jgi:Domain of unknown function (DUF5666)
MFSRTFAIALACGAAGSLSAASADPAVPAVPPAMTAPPPAAAPPSATPGIAPQKFRGTLSEFDGPFLTLTLPGRKTVTLGMTAQTRIAHNRSLALADLQPGSWVGVAALKGADGKLRAQGIRLYPTTMQGQGEGEYPLDPANPMRLLINGSLTGVTPGGIGGTLTVAFHGAAAASADCAGRAEPGGCSGIAEIQFARGVPILSIDAGDTTLLLPGAVLSVSAQPDPTGTLVATAITVERDAPAPKPVVP